jgi:hypothetical protein
MPQVDPYRSQYDYEAEPTASGALIFVGVITAIIVASLVWANFNPQLGANPPVTTTQPAMPKAPSPMIR